MNLHAAHSGQAYPADPAELRRLLWSALREAEKATETPPPLDSLPMLVAPHIDLRVDTATYAAAYRLLLDRPCFPETIFILGVGHRCPHEFSLAPARWITPLGSVEPDREVIDSINQKLGFETGRGLDTWEGEHSLEFAIVWLQALRDLAFPGAAFRVVPVLLGGLWPHVLAGKPPGPRTHVARFGKALMASAHELPQAAVIASIDGCHIGPRFDHPFPGEQAREGIERWERQLWDYCSTATHKEWFAHLASLRNESYFDGVGVLDLMLRNCHRKARVLHRRLWYEKTDQSFVTFTAAVLESNGAART